MDHEQNMESLEKTSCKNTSSFTRYLWAAVGFIFFALAVAGAILPLLPSTPFALVAAFAFAKSSKKLDAWFKKTKIYEVVVASYTERRAMTIKAKLIILIPVTILMGISCYFMDTIPWLRWVLGVVWLAHLIYFGFVVKTERCSQ